MGFMDDFQGDVVAFYIRRELNLERAAVIYNIADPYSQGIAEAFKESFTGRYQGELVAYEPFTTDQEDLSGSLNRIQRLNPQVVYIPTFSVQAEKVGVQARKAGIEAIFFGSDGWERRTLPSLPEFEGAFMTTHWSREITGSENFMFMSRFKERAGIEAGDVAALTYDAMKMVIAAILLEGKADPGSIRNGLYNLGPYEGISGTIDFVENGDPVKGATILKFVDGKTRFQGIVKPQ
jgi:branched-chain amino acid transport system substrate-binding protein